MKFKFWHIILLLIPYQVFAAYSPSQVLHQVATSGDYNHLTNCPVLHQIATTGDYNHLTNKPVLSTVATTGAYADLSGKPSLSVVATSGSYLDLSNKPTLFSGSYIDLTNKPTFHVVATSGLYSDLIGRPTFATVATSGSYNDLSGKPSLAIVASTGNYNDLINKPAVDTSNRIIYYNSTGRVYNTIKRWQEIITPNNTTGHIVNISSAGFSTITNVIVGEEIVTPLGGGANIKSEITARSNTSITIRTLKSGTSLVSLAPLISLSVLGTTAFVPLATEDLTRIRLHVKVEGY